jgi:hypothetical protein
LLPVKPRPWICRRAPEAAAGLRAIQRSLSANELDPPLRKRFMLWYSRIGALERVIELAFNSLDHYAREGTVGGAWGVLWLPEMAGFRDDETLPAHRTTAEAVRILERVRTARWPRARRRAPGKGRLTG